MLTTQIGEAISEAVCKKLERFIKMEQRVLEIDDAARYLGLTIHALRHKAGSQIPVIRIDTKLRSIGGISIVISTKLDERESEDKNDALRFLNRRRAEVDSRTISSASATVGDLLRLYLADQEEQRRKSRKQAEGYVRLHLAPAFEMLKASDLSAALIERFIVRKRREHDADASINRMLEALRRSFRLGMECTPTLVSTVPKFEMLEENNVREGFD